MLAEVWWHSLRDEELRICRGAIVYVEEVEEEMPLVEHMLVYVALVQVATLTGILHRS